VDPVDVDATVQASKTAEPTMSEALRVAAQRGMHWVGVRRDFAPPRELLSELLIATAKHAGNGVPGFAVFLADGEPPPFRRILAIVDRSAGPVSGLLAYAAVAVADSAGAHLDILVIGAQDENPHTEDKLDSISISREQKLYDEAVARARDRNVDHNWITAASVTDIWPVIADQLSQHDYDLVIDDLGDVSLARVGLRNAVNGTLDDGQVGEIPLKLLEETSVPLLFVIDEIRLGMAPKGLLKAGALATVAFGVVATPVAGAVAQPAPGTSSATIDPADDPILGLKAELATVTGQPLDDVIGDREVAAAQSSRSGGSGARSTAQQPEGQPTASPLTGAPAPTASVLPSPPEQVVETQVAEPDEAGKKADKKKADKKKESTKAKKPTAPKGGASPNDVAKAQRKAAESKSELQKNKAKTQRTKEAISEAEQELTEAQAGATVALANLQAAELSHEAAAEHAEEVSSAATGVSAVLPGAPSAEEVANAELNAQRAAERLEASVEFGEETLEEVVAVEGTIEAKQEKLDGRKADQAEAKADLEKAQLKADVYKASLAKSRQSPVTKGYNLTARFGNTGGYWSSGIHTGLDFAAPTGTPIKAAASGTVVSTGYKGAYGNQVVVNHGGGVKTTYSHLSSISVSPGQKVSTGDRLGGMGSTGNSTGSHLHFEVKQNGKFVDPEAWLGW
jgi:murein DD-endopeptidase MepM/ murein hydrolase activator NlpD